MNEYAKFKISHIFPDFYFKAANPSNTIAKILFKNYRPILK